MSDVLCDFCHAPWTEDVPFIEGHRGCVICGKCLASAYTLVVNKRQPNTNDAYTCVMCREDTKDRAALDRADERGWQSATHPESAVCTRCIKRAAGTLHKDPDFDWRKPSA